MKFAIIYLVFAGLFNPAVLLDRSGGNYSFWHTIKRMILMNVFGFPLTMYFSFTALFSRKQSKVQLESVSPEDAVNKEDDFQVAKGSQAYVSIYNSETIH